MQGSSTGNGPHHAHFDCFGGASTNALLAAVLHNQSREFVGDIERCIMQGMGNESKSMGLQLDNISAQKMLATTVNVVLPFPDGDSHILDMDEIRSMLDSVDGQYISNEVINKAKRVITELESAYRIVHGGNDPPISMSRAQHFEIVAVLLALEKLGVESVSCGPLPFGEGSSWTEQEGLLPIPSPMTLQLLVGMQTCPGPRKISDDDLIPPTAAALLRVLTNAGTTKRPSCFTTKTVGVGADTISSEPRILRMMLGQAVVDDCSNSVSGVANANEFSSSTHPIERSCDNSITHANSKWNVDRLTQLETNLDDMTAEALAFAVQLLLDNGAVDAWVVPIVMKKGRAAHTLHCLCHSDESTIDTLLELIFRHTTTLGVRIHNNIHRAALRRSFLSVTTPYHESTIRVKVGYLGKEEVVSIKAEFDDCALISQETGVPIQQVAESAIQRAREQLLEVSNEKQSSR